MLTRASNRPILRCYKVKDYVNMKPKALQKQPETWLETIAAGVACILSVIVFGLIVLMIGA